MHSYPKLCLAERFYSGRPVMQKTKGSGPLVGYRSIKKNRLGASQRSAAESRSKAACAHAAERYLPTYVAFTQSKHTSITRIITCPY